LPSYAVQKGKTLLSHVTRIKSANWHLSTRCNYNCKFCFSRKLDSEIKDLTEAHRILDNLKDIGIEKINLVGGEPLLHPLIFDIIKLAKTMGFVVSIVTNGHYLNQDLIRKLKPFIDWIGLSIDSADEEVEIKLGRGNGGHVKKVSELAKAIHDAGIKLKINTTVTRLSWMEDMRPLIRYLKPDRWKVFQVLHILGQNDDNFNELSITDEQFSYFKTLNHEPMEGIEPVFEGNKEMITSYLMISPSGLVMSNMDGANRTFLSLCDINSDNLSQIMDVQQYLERDAIYPW
jgi:radical S-adenosyl methionine domain-containing protein 2